MEEYCMVIAGEWLCGASGKWDFVIDKQEMSRMVPLHAGISLKELELSVLKEFGRSCTEGSVGLSYWPPTTIELATGIRTPPVLLTNDGAIRYFQQHCKVGAPLNLFAKFELCVRGFRREFAEDTYSTPAVGLRRKIFDDGYVSTKEGYVSSAASKVNVMSADETELVREVENVEEEIKKGNTTSNERVESDSFESDGSGSDFVDERDVRPRSYDKDFWAPLIQDDFGGSDAVDVVFNGEDTDPRTYSCTTNNGSAHTFEAGGSSGSNSKPEPKAEGFKYPWSENSGWDNVADDRNKETRRLDEVDDDEFDIPPLFDDTVYEVEEIPDLDADEDDGRIYPGKMYGSKEDCQISLAIYAIKHQIQYKQTITKFNYFVVECPDAHCDWRVTAHEVKGCGFYEIRKAQLEHRCPIETRVGFKKRVTSRVIAAVYKAKFGNPTMAPKAKQLQKLVLEDLKLSTTYMKCYRAIDQAVIDVRGTEEESYLKLPQYLHMLKLANPGTVADLETDIDEKGRERFLYLFLAFGASIEGFQKLRHVVVVDGTHLTGKYKGVLLTASGQDANFQVFPLAYVVVDSENLDSWTWFFQKLERIIADSRNLAIISDRATCIATAATRIFPLARHGSCIVHLARNVNSRFSNKGLSKLVTKAAMAYTITEYKDYFNKIRSCNSACLIYLSNIGAGHWSRVYFAAERYNIMTSNIAEQLNKALSEGRGCPIKELVTFIQRMMTRWFNARRNKSERHRGVVSVEVDKEMTKSMANVRGSEVNNVSNWSSEVVGMFGGKFYVCLADKKCSCKYFDRLKIPCGHAMLAADKLGLPYDSLVGHWYKTCTWRATYAGIIRPEENPKDVEIPSEVVEQVLFPPVTKRPSGRHRTKRIPSTGEYSVVKKKKTTLNVCGRCHLSGHNRTNCTNPI